MLELAYGIMLATRQQNLTILKVKKSSKNGKQTIKMLSLN
jgi:hypothetical protein